MLDDNPETSFRSELETIVASEMARYLTIGLCDLSIVGSAVPQSLEGENAPIQVALNFVASAGTAYTVEIHQTALAVSWHRIARSLVLAFLQNTWADKKYR